MKIKNIIFDFGGVLLNLDYSATYNRLSELMDVKMSITNIPKEIEPVFLRYEKGEINDENFIWSLQNFANGVPSAREIIDAWNAMLLGWNPDRFNMLLDLQKEYEIYLLSNTNSLHLDWVIKDLATNHNIHHFNKKYFDKTFYSHLIGMRKPDEEIYRYVLQDANLNPGETLFIDDNEENISSAKKVGLLAQLHNPSDEIMDKIDAYLS